MRVARRPQGAVERSETEVREEYTVMDGKDTKLFAAAIERSEVMTAAEEEVSGT